jgi:hypothetical protein
MYAWQEKHGFVISNDHFNDHIRLDRVKEQWVGDRFLK